ncbi:MAG: O-antigen ligase family protein [Candidatus Andersenbacteria bacterium]|nr:O-antigen ligase family protein [Candidatus Andersenbacteria bacterium]
MSLTLQSHVAWALIAVVSAGVLAMAVNVQVGFFALLFVLVAWWVWEHEELSLLYFIALAPLLPMFKITQTLGTFTLIKDVLILTLFVKAFAWPLITQKLPYRRNIFLLPIILLIGWGAVGLLMADSLTLGILRSRDIGLYILLYMTVLYMDFNPVIMKQRLKWLTGSAVVLLLAGVYQYFWAADSAVLRFDPVRSIWIPRISSTFAHPTVFGEYLVLLASGAAAFAMTSKRYRWWAIGASVLLMPFIYFTYSRGVWLGYIAALGIIALAAATQRLHISLKTISQWLISLMAVLMLLGLLVWFTPVGTFLRTSLDPAYASNQIRLEFLARLVGNTSNGEALFGHGLGDISQKIATTPDVGASDITSGASRDVQLAKDSTLVDNQYLKTFIELGLAGLLIYVWIYMRAIKYSWKLFKTHEMSGGKLGMGVLGLAALGFFLSFMLEGLFVDIWDVFPTNAIFWIVAAMVSAHQEVEASIDRT